MVRPAHLFIPPEGLSSKGFEKGRKGEGGQKEQEGERIISLSLLRAFELSKEEWSDQRGKWMNKVKERYGMDRACIDGQCPDANSEKWGSFSLLWRRCKTFMEPGKFGCHNLDLFGCF